MRHLAGIVVRVISTVNGELSQAELRLNRQAPLFLALCLAGCSAPFAGPAEAGNADGQTAAAVQTAFDVVEVTIAECHEAMLAHRLTARQLVQLHLDRIAAYDQRGPVINSLITLNPRALQRADELDAALAETGNLVGPLHGIPVIVKDNFDTADLPTTGGSLAFRDSQPPDDAFLVRRLRAAGAIVLAKSNMAEFAFSPYETLGSMLPGHTRNPYALDRVPAGSSGGTAAAVAASFGVAGLGSDTGNSIRGPSAHTALVGIRPTMGLTSRDGIIPLFLDKDVGGPMARTVADAATILEVVAGYDPADPVTELSQQHRARHAGYKLRQDALHGARIGVLRQISNRGEPDAEILDRFAEAMRVMSAGGARIVDPVTIPEQEQIPGDDRWCIRFRVDMEAYLRSLGSSAPFRTLDELIASNRYHPSVQGRLNFFAGVRQLPELDPHCQLARKNNERLRAAVSRVMREEKLDALAYPTWSTPPRRIGDLNSAHGDNSQDLAPPTGFPALTVPMGYVRDQTLPTGLQLLGDAWSEDRLIAIAYAYEQATRHRRPPPATPPLAARPGARIHGDGDSKVRAHARIM